MKNRKWMFVLLMSLFVIQLSVPAYMIGNREMTLRYGKQFKFKAEPIDPFDAFRGRYVEVNIRNEGIDVAEGEKYMTGDRVFVLLETDAQGFALMKSISKERPKGTDYFETRIYYGSFKEDGVMDKAYVRIPFSRYYMEESLAPKAEEEYNRSIREQNKEVYVTVRVRNGSTVLEGLFIEGVRVEEYLKKY
ncbi:MAG: GDYXXLXY domain-containing protein [Clostridia bacterium]|nr:GDYXXLXY domain-containing protein [Clostridia bacterium]